ncbi:MAG: HDOD domain-containing protein [Syntrophales bacterium]
MGVVKIAHLRPGMVVSCDVKDCNGRLLVAAGSALSDNHIRVLKIWGIVEAEVESIAPAGDTLPLPAVIDPALLTAAEEAIRTRFRHADPEDAAGAELLRIASLREALRMQVNGPAAPPAATRRRSGRRRGGIRSTMSLELGEGRLGQIEEMLRKDIKLTSLPDVFTRINEAIMRPSSSSREIADLISQDTGLSARLLKVVNSAFYGYPSRIDSLPQAVSIVGTNQLSMLALGIDVISEFKGIPGGYINMDLFWRHSVACGIIARLIAATKNIQNTERLFVAGMLHDIGRLVVYHCLPHDALDILEKARDSEEPLSRLETEYLGGDHAEIGGLLLQIWSLPLSLENAVRYHHHPAESPNGLEPAIVHVADVTAKALGIGSSGDQFVPALDPVAWKQIGLSSNALEPITAQADRQLEETFHLFFNET